VSDQVSVRAKVIFNESLREVQAGTSRMFIWVFLVQWALAIVLAVTISPYAWQGSVRTIHLHVVLAVVGGAVVNALPISLIILRPNWSATRHVVAVGQMLWSAILVNLTGGRIETHFHIFGSLAFLAFYRDVRVLITATLVVAVDHLLLGLFWPESVYGIVNPEWWRFAEHGGWVIFEDAVLFAGCRRALRDMWTQSTGAANLEEHSKRLLRQYEKQSLTLARIGRHSPQLLLVDTDEQGAVVLEESDFDGSATGLLEEIKLAMARR
jgi:hypothetical protein